MSSHHDVAIDPPVGTPAGAEMKKGGAVHEEGIGESKSAWEEVESS